MEDQKPIWSEWFCLDEDGPTGLRWKVDVWCGRYHNVKLVSAGDIAGCDNKHGYFKVMLRYKNYLVHRIVLALSGVQLKPEDKVDHIDGNRGNNRIANLRVATSAANSQNRSRSSRNITGKVGVSKMHKRGAEAYYIGTVSRNGKNISKCFSIPKLGEAEAFRLACAWRDEELRELNKDGASYTERHGT